MLLPNARDNEFVNIINEIDIIPGMTIVDMPSGGNYLKSYLPDNVNVIPLETSEIFAKLGHTKICNWSSLPLKNNSVDTILCCAAFHHVETKDRLKFRDEVERVLKVNGKLIIADVELGSQLDHYLNGFVNDNNSMGHVGWFLDKSFGDRFATENLVLKRNIYKEFLWEFSDDIDTSMAYMKLLFGIDKASKNDVKSYLKKHLNLVKVPHEKYKINWGLRYVTFSKKC